jgi:hypothetical protein
LYWFRTPPGVRVGRAAIDEDAIRLLEQHNPDVQFDWTRILKQPQSPESPQRQQKPLPRPQREERPPRPREQEPAPEPAVVELEPVAEEPAELLDAVEPHLIEEPAPPQPEMRPAAVSERIGPEGLARLRARYAEVMARIAERPLEEAARDELKARAERLNPDAWVTDDEVREGLEQYETVFESLRPMIGHPRRRRRRRG